MLNRLSPFFNVDSGAIGDSGGDWMSMAQSAMSETADDVQPEGDTDAEALDTVETVEASEESETVAETKTPETPQAFNDESDIDMGEGRQPIKLSELKLGYQRQSDYTKKTQELATQRKEVEELQSQLQPTKEWLDYLNSNPWVSQQINTLIQEFQTTGTLPIEEVLADAQYGQYVNHLMGQVNSLQKELDGLKGEYEGVKLSSEMTRLQTDLKADYGDLVTDEYINTLQERGKAEKLNAATLREIADGHLTKQQLQQTQQKAKTATKEAEAKTIQQIQETRKALPPQPGSAGQIPSQEVPNTTSMSWLDMAKMAGKAIKG